VREARTVRCRRLALAACCLLAASASAGGQGTSQPTTQPGEAFRDFEFVSMTVGGVAFHVQEPLADRRDELADALREFLADQEAESSDAEELTSRADEIVAEIHALVGLEPDAETRDEHRRMLRFFLGTFRLDGSGPRLTVYALGQQSVKGYLRSGGTLPDYSYDPETGKAAWAGWWTMRKGEEVPDAMTWPLPLNEDRPVEDLRSFLGFCREQLGTSRAGIGFHEVAEASIVSERLRPTGPYFRWFSDGFANVIAIRLLRTYCGAERAKAYAAAFEPDNADVPAEELNLLYWPGGAALELNLPGERAMRDARYAWATHEARRLADAYGIGIVADVLDAACTGEGTGAERLLTAVNEVTGEDVGSRLLRYQTFGSIPEGFEKYGPRVLQARKEGKPGEAIAALVRLHELSADAPFDYGKASVLLGKMGLAETADRVFRSRVALAAEFDDEKGRVAWLTAFLCYAMQVGRPAIAYEQAEALLELRADDPIGLILRTYRLRDDGRLDEAEQTARKALSLAPEDAGLVRREAVLLLGDIRGRQRGTAGGPESQPAHPAP
jgi:tetratricopeptide (TPR) repeat protein